MAKTKREMTEKEIEALIKESLQLDVSILKSLLKGVKILIRAESQWSEKKYDGRVTRKLKALWNRETQLEHVITYINNAIVQL